MLWTLMNTNLESLLELAGKHARIVLVEMGFPELLPSWLLINSDGTCHIVGTPWQDERDKERQVKRLALRMRREHTVAYSFVCEAWSAWLDPGEYDPETGEIPEALRARNRPNRREVVTALAADKTRAIYGTWEIQRDWEGKIVKLVPDDMSEITTSSSWMAELLMR